MENGIRSHAERHLATFRHEKVQRIVWQPRFDDWYSKNYINLLNEKKIEEQRKSFELKCPDLPTEIFGMKLPELYEYLDASPRYYHEFIRDDYMNKFSRDNIGFTGQIFKQIPNPNAEIEHKWINDDWRTTHKITTPYGDLTESWKKDSTYPVERVLKKREDIKALIYYLQNSTIGYEFQKDNYEAFLKLNEMYGNRLTKTTSPWRNPYNKCIVELAGTAPTMIIMQRYTEEFDKLCDEINRINFEIIMPAILNSPMDFVSLGENIDCRNNPPPVYEKYQVPFFEKMGDICGKAGKFTYAHFDGFLEDLLPYLEKDVYPLDGIEAPTFQPQGDVTLDEFKRVWDEEKIILDGIPSTLFLPYFSESRFISYVENVLEQFSPNLILGVSDEYSPNGLFKRLKMVTDIVANFIP